MSGEHDTVSLGSCPTCHGPAQFIAQLTCPTCDGAGWTAETTADPLPSGEPGEPYQVQRTCDDCGGKGLLSGVRHVELPNIAEDLGGGWTLMEISRLLLGNRDGFQWRAIAEHLDGAKRGDIEYGWDDSPAAAYLALRTAIEARP